MTLADAKEEFIQAWGGLGSNWGINKTMAQIHALMLVSDDPLSCEDVMEKLMISRGNTNLNLRALVDWNLIRRTAVKGERKEFFVAEKDVWRMATRIAHERRKRELEPMLKSLDNLKAIDINSGETQKIQEFRDFVGSLEDFANKVDNIFNVLVKADHTWFGNTLLKMLVK